MIEPLISSAVISSFKPIVQRTLKVASRIHAERNASIEILSVDLLGDKLNQTLKRLQGPEIEDDWWRGIMNRFGHEYISPEFLKKPALVEWLCDPKVAENFTNLAKQNLLQGTRGNEESRARLAKSYSAKTGESKVLANGPIDVVLSILVSGFLASIPDDQMSTISLILEFFKQNHQPFDDLELPIQSNSVDPIVEKAHSQEANQILSEILLLRIFDLEKASKYLRILYNRITSGDLVAVDEPTRERIFAWTAILHTESSETLDFAKQVRENLAAISPDFDFSIVDALIAEADGDADKAIQYLRDPNDSESRSVLFGVLARNKGCKFALNWYAENSGKDDHFFTALGWKYWAVCMVRRRKWRKASKKLLELESLWDESPYLAIAEGMVNAAMLLPKDYRPSNLGDFPFIEDISPRLGKNAEELHERATYCFQFAIEHVQSNVKIKVSHSLKDWCLWLRLMDPISHNSDSARTEVRQGMNIGSDAVRLIRFAYFFNIEYEPKHLRNYLEQRKLLGGLNDEESFADFLLTIDTLDSREFVGYLELHQSRLRELMPAESLIAFQIQALSWDGQTDRANQLLEKHSSVLNPEFSERLKTIITAKEGHDPRSRLEKQYSRTKSLVDLKSLIKHLKGLRDSRALRPLLLELFEHERNVKNALDVVHCLSGPPFFEHHSVLDFLNSNSDIVKRNEKLKTVKVWALIQAGRFFEASKINNILFDKRQSKENLLHKLEIEILVGNWERIPNICSIAWEKRESYDAETFIKIALLASFHKQEIDRALKFARLAVNESPKNPQILSAAYWLHFQLGREDDADQNWLIEALEFSSQEDGPVWRVDADEIITKWLPDRRKFVNDIEQKWLSGDLPMRSAASELNFPLTRLLLNLPAQNSATLDGRKRMLLPAIAGGKIPVDLQKDWTISLDIVSILTLFHLDLLETAIDAFHHTLLANNVFEDLFHEKQTVQFHQPLLVTQAKEINHLINQGKIRIEENPFTPKESVVNEVGPELSQLLESARQNNGRVICSLPIYRDGSLMKELADTVCYDDLILSTVDVCNILHDDGRIDDRDFSLASYLLFEQGQKPHSNATKSVLAHPIYIDRIALSHLQYSKILDQVIGNCQVVNIHPNTEAETNALIGESEIGEKLVSEIERIRETLRNAVDSGKASFLPCSTDQNTLFPKSAHVLGGTRSLLENADDCDAICIDDRTYNKFSRFANNDNDSVPIACVLDVIHYLASHDFITKEDEFAYRHKLRLAGFAFVPLEPNELLHWLRAAKSGNDQLIESLELKTVRQTIARISSANFASKTETFEITSNITLTCGEIISTLWSDESLPVNEARLMSDWVWDCLCTSNFLGRNHLEGAADSESIKNLLAQRLALLLIPIVTQSDERRNQYTDWLEHSVLNVLNLANSDVVELALKLVSDAISLDHNYRDVNGSLFLAQLPKSMYIPFAARETEFVNQCKFKPAKFLRVGADVELETSKLFDAVRRIFSTGESETIHDDAGKELTVKQSQDNRVFINWTDSDGTPCESELPVLSLLSNDSKIRINSFRPILEYLGPTAIDIHNLEKKIHSGGLNDQEQSEIMDELANGVAARQYGLDRKLSGSIPITLADIIPPTVSYFEKFCGSIPEENQSSESYIKKVLIPYRQGLLKRNFRVGLEICCLGAVHDDLMPGRWLSDVDDDTLWNTIDLFHSTHNPFSMVAVLDISLYRQHDQRFRELSESIVSSLLESRALIEQHSDSYEYFRTLSDVIFNSINRVESFPNRPNYWKRLCALMQAGFVTHASAKSFEIDESKDLKEWLFSKKSAAGIYSEFIGSRNEPMLLIEKLTPYLLHFQIFACLDSVKTRHESEGRSFPSSERIEDFNFNFEYRNRTHILKVPGPLDGSKRPKRRVTKQLFEILEKPEQDGNERFSLLSLAEASHYFALRKVDLDRACSLVQSMAKEIDTIESQNVIFKFECANIIAATNRDLKLADTIADVLIDNISNVSTEEQLALVLSILLQAAAANESHDSWFSWLEEKLVELAVQLPKNQNDLLEKFLDHLNEIEMVLPVKSWFHERAKIIALAGS